MFYLIIYENGEMIHDYFNFYNDCLNYAESYNVGLDFTIDVYYSEDDYYENL